MATRGHLEDGLEGYPWTIDGLDGHYSPTGVEEAMGLPLYVLYRPDENGEQSNVE